MAGFVTGFFCASRETERSMQNLETYLDQIHLLPVDQQKELLAMLEKIERIDRQANGQKDYSSFARHVWPDLIWGSHLNIMADAFNRVASGELKRLIINMPPRHSKSENASYMLPAWFIGRFPRKKIIQATHTAELAVNFGRKVKNLLTTETYSEIFPNIALAADAKAAGRWNTSVGGEYWAVGVGANLAGKGADLFIIDDPISEQQALSGEYNPEAHEKVFEWYQSGPRQRLQPGGAIILVQTRWSKRDLTGKILAATETKKGIDKWEVIHFPAIMPANETRGESPLWPEFWTMAELESLRAELPIPKWQAQYQQDPTSEEGALVKRDWWNKWETSRPPPCDFIIQSWDTAYQANNRADFSACTTWGVFDLDGTNNLILLDAFQERMEFPDLKRAARRLYDEFQPDCLVVEQKASGTPLTHELRAMGIPVQEYTPSRGTSDNPNTKLARVNSITDMFSSGMIWAPDTKEAEEVVEQFAAFPLGDHDDLVDASTIALMRFRQGGFLTLPSDEWESHDDYDAPARYY